MAVVAAVTRARHHARAVCVSSSYLSLYIYTYSAIKIILYLSISSHPNRIPEVRPVLCMYNIITRNISVNRVQSQRETGGGMGPRGQREGALASLYTFSRPPGSRVKINQTLHYYYYYTHMRRRRSYSVYTEYTHSRVVTAGRKQKFLYRFQSSRTRAVFTANRESWCVVVIPSTTTIFCRQ